MNNDFLTDQDRWEQDKKDFGWKLPECSQWKRLPIIRHLRVIYLSLMLMLWRRYWDAQGFSGLHSGYDNWVLYGIWRGFK